MRAAMFLILILAVVAVVYASQKDDTNRPNYVPTDSSAPMNYLFWIAAAAVGIFACYGFAGFLVEAQYDGGYRRNTGYNRTPYHVVRPW
jgi:succinate dehydrogenase/fumarate reductase cytochrome b subunit